jgi:hypothetical protein
MEEMRSAHKIFVREPERKTSVATSKRRWEDNIKTDHTEIVCCGLDLFGSGWGPAVGSCEHGNEISG